MIELLQVEIDELTQPAQQQVVDHKPVKLMTMDGQVTHALIFPDILPIHRDTNQVRQQIREPMIVIALNPHHFNVALGIRKLADAGEKLPMFFLKATKIQIAEDVAQQDQPAEVARLEQFESTLRTAYFRSQVDIRDNERVEKVSCHTAHFDVHPVKP